MAEKVLIYAGTTEGRLLAQELSREHIACDVHVATEYGQMVMPELAGVKVCVGRLDVEEMRALLKKNGQNNYAAVVDATHPFATEVSANIRESTKGSGIPYLRLQRRMDDGICSISENEGMKERAGTVHVFADYESCVQALTDTSGNILLTTGSKELAVFAPLKERLFVRVLPGLESIGGNDPSVFDPLSGYKSQWCAQRISGKTCGSAESRYYGMRDRETGTGTGNVLCTGNRNTFPSAWTYDFRSSGGGNFPDWHRYECSDTDTGSKKSAGRV